MSKRKLDAGDTEALEKKAKLPDGYAEWRTTTTLAAGTPLGKYDAQWNPNSNDFLQRVDVHYHSPFILKPLTLTEGPYEGRHVLMLQPVKIKEFFPFLDLPAEIRTVIYEEILEEEENIDISTVRTMYTVRRACRKGFQYRLGHWGMRWDDERAKWLNLTPSNFSLLRVSKQVLQECAPIAYGSNRFSFNSMSAAYVFLRGIGDMRRYLRHIIFCRHAYMKNYAGRVFKHLQDAKGLRSISFPHAVVCTNNLDHGYSYRFRCRGRFCDPYDWAPTVDLQSIITACKRLLKALWAAQGVSDRSLEILNLVQVVEYLPFRRCGPEDHHQALREKARMEIAKVLGLSLPASGENVQKHLMTNGDADK